MRRGLPSLMIVLALAPAVEAADSWPQWRGPNRDAISTDKNLLDRWQGAPPLVWKAEGLGIGYAGAAIDQGIVCTLGDRNGQTTVIAIRDKDGKEIWATPIDHFKINGNSDSRPRAFTGSKSTPTMDGECIYAVSSEGVLACLKIATGERVWQKSYPRDFAGFAPEWGYAESPLIDGDKLICSPGGPKAGIVAFDKMIGKELWLWAPPPDKVLGIQGATYASAVVSHGAGVKQYVQLIGQRLFGIDARTGKQLWHNRAGAWTNPCTPIVRGDYVFAPSGESGESVLLKLISTNNGGVEAKEVYVLPMRQLSTCFGGAVLVGNYIYANHTHTGCPQCVEFSTGKVMWKARHGPGEGPASVVYADGHLYFRYQDGVVALVAATPDQYQMKGQFRMPIALRPGRPDSWAHPAISNGRLYLRQHDALYCYDLRK